MMLNYSFARYYLVYDICEIVTQHLLFRIFMIPIDMMAFRVRIVSNVRQYLQRDSDENKQTTDANASFHLDRIDIYPNIPKLLQQLVPTYSCKKV